MPNAVAQLANYLINTRNQLQLAFERPRGPFDRAIAQAHEMGEVAILQPRIEAAQRALHNYCRAESRSSRGEACGLRELDAAIEDLISFASSKAPVPKGASDE